MIKLPACAGSFLCFINKHFINHYLIKHLCNNVVLFGFSQSLNYALLICNRI